MNSWVPVIRLESRLEPKLTFRFLCYYLKEHLKKKEKEKYCIEISRKCLSLILVCWYLSSNMSNSKTATKMAQTAYAFS